MIYILYTRKVVGSQAQLFPRAEIRIKSHGVKNDSVKDALLLLLAQAIVLSEISLNTRGKFVSNIERKKMSYLFSRNTRNKDFISATLHWSLFVIDVKRRELQIQENYSWVVNQISIPSISTEYTEVFVLLSYTEMRYYIEELSPKVS